MSGVGILPARKYIETGKMPVPRQMPMPRQDAYYTAKAHYIAKAH
ncbi:hypothetical protein [Moorena sp. SIO3I6]|nr:hypothetical protein [Moorena sp. SIO3I6]